MERRAPLLAVMLASICGVAVGGETTGSLYQRLGGADKVTAIANDALARASCSAQGPALPVQDLASARQALAAHICAVSGGGCARSGDDGTHGALTEALRESMRAHSVPLSARNELLELLAPNRRDVASL